MDAARTSPSSNGEVGRWLLVSAGDGDAGPWLSRRHIVPVSYRWPAAPDRTVRAVLPHTALRHRSSCSMRSRVAHCSGEPADPQVPKPIPCKAISPVEPGEPVFATGQHRDSFMNVVIDCSELRRGVPLPEVVAPAPQHGVELFDHHTQVEPDPTRGRRVTNLASDRGHSPW